MPSFITAHNSHNKIDFMIKGITDSIPKKTLNRTNKQRVLKNIILPEADIYQKSLATSQK
jgi:hypothetical protein